MAATDGLHCQGGSVADAHRPQRLPDHDGLWMIFEVAANGRTVDERAYSDGVKMV